MSAQPNRVSETKKKKTKGKKKSSSQKINLFLFARVNAALEARALLARRRVRGWRRHNRDTQAHSAPS
jgi:hypothetical protein